MKIEVVIPTMGECPVVLSGLLGHAPLPGILRLVCEHFPRGAHTLMLLEAIRRHGTRVVIDARPGPVGLGRARCHALSTSDADVLIQIDDDMVLVGADPLEKLAAAAQGEGYACPVIRYPQNFETQNNLYAHHRETWEQVSEDHEGRQQAIAAYGEDMARFYDIGRDARMLGAASNVVAVRRDAFAELASLLSGWPERLPGEDMVMGGLLSRMYGYGVVVTGVYAYHAGIHNPGAWSSHDAWVKMCLEHPSAVRRLVEEAR